MIRDHLFPLERVPLLEREPLRVHAVGQNHRRTSVLDGPEDVGPDDEAVVHRDRLLPGDAHAVANLGALLDLGPSTHRDLLLPCDFPLTRRGVTYHAGPDGAMCADT